VNPQTNFLAVGFFLVLGIAATVVLIIWLGRAGDSQPKEQYVVEIEGDVNGLGNGSAVRYLGVNVGSVVDIRLHTEAEPHVDVYIAIQEGLPVDEATYATLVVQGVTGIANIDLGSDRERARPQVTNKDGYIVIPFRATGLSAMLASSGDLTTDARQLLAQLNVLTGEENLVRMRTILNNLESVSQTLADERGQIPMLLEDVRAAVASFERAGRGLESVVRDDWPEIAADLKATSGSLRAVSARVDGWLENNDDNVERLLGEGLSSVTAMAVDLRETADELSRLSAKLRDDPSRIIYRTQHDPVVAEP
jgi:phospholipid/cholesterol/gamma-HCH transport system substrate-binding protein